MIDLLWAYVLVFLLAAVPFIESIVIDPFIEQLFIK